MPDTINISNAVKKLNALSAELVQVEAEYETQKDIISKHWKVYHEAAPKKKAALARKKELKRLIKEHVEKSPELKALVASIN